MHSISSWIPLSEQSDLLSRRLAKLADQHPPVTGSGTSLQTATGGESGTEGLCSAHSQYGAPQGCCLGPSLFSLYTWNCTSDQDDNIIVNTVVLGLIKGRDGSLYRDLVHNMTSMGKTISVWDHCLDRSRGEKQKPLKTMRRREGDATHVTLSEL